MPFLTDPVLTAGAFAAVPQPEIPTGDGLLLRPWQASDAPAVYAAFQDPLMHRWQLRAADSAHEVRGWIEEWRGEWATARSVQWAVVDAGEGALLGRVALHHIDLVDGVGEIGYWTVPAARGEGVAARGTSALARWALDEAGFGRLELTHALGNGASCRVAAKCGFALEGTKRSAVLYTDGRQDVHLHARVRGD
ncbi:GNAT family N-acetyltransferase [Streptomyces sp. NPDC053367]|uniref:GNAT family N-acetyltransferase n=1 Tax=Streptomyces sp. NPDC053367 TaxID=3365700 RepID=UPI0037D6CDFE